MPLTDGPRTYILRGKTPVRCDDRLEFARWFERVNRRVALDRIGDVEVSTVFLGVDHNLSGEGPPLLFETATARGDEWDIRERYPTWAEAEAGHRRWCYLLRETLGSEA